MDCGSAESNRIPDAHERLLFLTRLYVNGNLDVGEEIAVLCQLHCSRDEELKIVGDLEHRADYSGLQPGSLGRLLELKRILHNRKAPFGGGCWK